MSDKPNYDMTGILFKNDKEGNDQRPDYKGNITFGGVEYELAGWIRQGKKGSFMTLKVSERKRKDVSGEVSATPPSPARTKMPTREPVQQGGPREYAGEQPAGRGRQIPDDQFDDDIPF